MKMRYAPARIVVALALGLLSAPALAHPGHAGASFAAGLAHPPSGLDHILAMSGIGLLAVRVGGRAMVTLPIVFLAAMIAGSMVAMAGVALPGTETLILGTALLLGLLIALPAPPALPLATAVAALFALPHGYAHGVEMPMNGASVAYISGFSLAAALLIATGESFALALRRGWRDRHVALLRLSGAAIMGMGLSLA